MADEHKPEYEMQTPDPAHTEKQDHAPDAMTKSDGLAPPPPDTSHHSHPHPNPNPNPNAPRSADASAAPSTAPSVAASVANNAINAPTQIVFTDPDFANPPDLNYGLRQRKKSIAIFWTLIILDCVAMPIALYFGLWYGTSLSHNAVFSISTGALGTVSIVEYFIRFHRLWKKGSTCRVIGARRFYLDWFHWNLSVAWMAIMVELIVGTVPEEPPIRLLAMPVPTMAYAMGIQLLLVDILRIAGVRSPIRISSLPRGSPLRPGIYAFIEDVCAVDGSGGTEFRQRLNLRYQASHMFRQMLHRLTLFWAFGALGIAAITTAIIFTVNKDVAYVIGWVIPFIWAGIWALVTTKWVQMSLADEHAMWTQEKSKA